MRTTACPTPAQLAAYDRGDLPERSLDAITAHLENCGACELVIQTLDGKTDPLLDALRRLEPASTWRIAKPTPPADTADFDEVTRRAAGETLPQRLGAYEIQGELGRGGMGVVYKAWHPGLKRFVALKVIRAGADAGADDFMRFRREAEAMARLQHANLVQVYEIGYHDGRPYLALEYVAGGSLNRHLNGRPQPARAAAELVATLADAIHHAHQHGVVHRDLKPANVLLTLNVTTETPTPNSDSSEPLQGAVPKITDFGLAKSLHADVSLTAHNAILGTPQYMAPEQASSGQEIGPATDVHALGAILYEMLTGRPPATGATPMETLLQVVQQEPVSVERIRTEVPRDLSTVCMKCLRKEPGRRYESAAALANDLRRFLDGRPVQARPVSLVERAAKWMRRYPALAAALAAIVLLTLVGFVLVTWQWNVAEGRAVAETAAKHEVERLSAGRLLDQALGMCAGGEIDHGLLTLAHALEAATQAGETDLARAARFNLAAWQPLLIRPRARFTHRGWAWTVAFSPDGRTAVTGGEDGLVQRWDTATGQTVGEPLRHAHAVWALAFSPDGAILVTGSGKRGTAAGEARLWDTATGLPRCPPLAHDSSLVAVAFRPDGSEFLTVCAAGAQRWDAGTCKPIGPRLRHATPESPLRVGTYSRDGKRLATGSGNPQNPAGSPGLVCLWDAATGTLVGQPVIHSGPVMALDFSPDSRTLATGGYAVEVVEDSKRLSRLEGEVRLVNAADGKERGAPLRQRGPVRTLAFSPDGGLLAAGLAVLELAPDGLQWSSIGGEVRLWQVPTGTPFGRPLNHSDVVWAVAFSPDGRLLLTGDQGGNARFFSVAGGELIGKPLGHEGTVTAVAFSKDGHLALTSSAGGDRHAAARLWEAPAPPTNRTFQLETPRRVSSLAFSPDGKRLLASYSTATALVWDLATGQPVGPALSHADPANEIGAVISDARGTRWLTCSKNGARLWDAADGRLLADCPLEGLLWRAAFGSGPTGPVLMTGSQKGAVQFWQATDGAPLGVAQQFSGEIAAATFLPNGEATWVEKDVHTFRVWQGVPGKPPTQIWEQQFVIWNAVFSPDGRQLLTSGPDRKAQLWDVALGRPRGPTLSNQGQVIDTLGFSPDGSILFTGGRDRTVRLWDTVTGKSLGAPLPHPFIVISAAFDPSGRKLAVGCDKNGIHLWELPTPMAGEPSQLRKWAEDLTGLERSNGGTIREIHASAAPVQ